MSKTVTEADYAARLKLLEFEVTCAFEIFHIHQEIDRLAREDASVLMALHGTFWTTIHSALQTDLFMRMSRVFETKYDASVGAVVDQTIKNFEFFSQAGLRARKTGKGPEPEWLEDFMEKAWTSDKAAPDSYKKVLLDLKEELERHRVEFEEIYKPIRNRVYGHMGAVANSQRIELFEKTDRRQLEDILNFLRELVAARWHLYQNGTRPSLGQQQHSMEVTEIRREVERVLRSVSAGSQTAPKSDAV